MSEEVDVPHIVSAQELARFLKLRDSDGNPLTVTESTDPSLQDLNDLLMGVEEEFESEAFHSYGKTVQTEEPHDLIYEWEGYKGRPVYLGRIDCKEIDETKGDFVKIIIQNRERTVTPDFFNLKEGIMWFREYALFDNTPRLRIKYRYGTDKAPYDIKLAVKKLAFLHVVEGAVVNQTIDLVKDLGVPLMQTTERWREDVRKVISRHRVFSYGR